MPYEILTTENAIKRSGWRMTIVKDVPSPWGEVAKGLLHLKNIDWTAVYLNPLDDKQVEWTGQLSAPCVVLDNKKPVSAWTDILFLAERLSPEPAMLPEDTLQRSIAMGFAHEFCGRWGLGWSRRLQLIDAGLRGEGGFAEPVAKYLAAKYGFRQEIRERAETRTLNLLNMFAEQLHKQKEQGSNYYFGETIGYVDLCSAAFMGMFKPLSVDVCPMRERTRKAFETQNSATKSALDPVLFEHRDRIYKDFLEIPLTL